MEQRLIGYVEGYDGDGGARLGALVRRFRRAAGLSQQEVADRAGMSVGGLRDLEQGRVVRPRPATLSRLATALHLREADAAELARLRQRVPVSGSGLRLRVLGPLMVQVDGIQVAPGSVQQRALLGLLAVCANRPVSLDALIEVVWGAQPPPGAPELIQTRVSRLRQRLRPKANGLRAAGQPLLWVNGGYQLTVGDEQLDLLVFRRLVERARRAAAEGDGTAGFAYYQEAVQLWWGQPLADLPQLHVHPAVADLDREWRSVVVAHADLAAELGQHGRAVPLLRRVIEADPLDEPVHARLIAALVGSGEPAAALAVYDRLRHRLADELGVDPGPELQRLHQATLRGEPVRVVAGPAPRPSPDPHPVPAQLLAEPPGFTGRHDQLIQLDRLLDAARRDGTALTCVLSGTAGVGKTALALHWAHRIRDRFPDGQLYVNLRGFDPARSAVASDEAVRVFLDALGVPAERVPANPDAQTALYRSLLAGKQVLVVLDNASDAAQVRPLLPGSPGCVALVTSRSQLTGLIAAEGARPVPLQLLSSAEARQLLAGRLGDDRVAAEPEAVDEIVARCARLPLALAVVAARAASHPDLPLRAVTAQLRRGGGDLDALRGEDAATDVRTVLSWSYQALSAPAARLFRLLGLHPGPDVAAPAAASLVGAAPAEVRPLLHELAQAHLVAVPSPERYAMHDLLRAYAVELADEVESDADRSAAASRVLDHYLHTADTADRLIYPHRDRVGLLAPDPGSTVERFADAASALAWFAAERPVLLTAVTHAAAAGFDRHTWQLALTLLDFFHRRGHWHDWVASHEVALAAAQRLGNRAAQAYVHHGLGRAFAQLGCYRKAHRHHGRAVELFDQLGDQAGAALVHLSLSFALSAEGRDAEALAHDQRALELYRLAGHRSGQANALNSLGCTSGQLGDHESALRYCREALVLQRELGDRRAEACTLDSVGQTYHQLGRYAEATAYYRQAVDLLRRTQGVRYSQSLALTHLGDNHHAAGEHEAAADAWRQALEILEELGHPDAERIRGKLAGPAAARH